MRYIKVKARVWNVENPATISKKVELLTNTRAVYMILPSSLLKELKVRLTVEGDLD